MALHKKFIIKDSHTDEVIEEFDSMDKAEELMIILQKKGMQVTVKTADEDQQTPDSFDIEGLDIDEPTVEFGSDLDEFIDDSTPFDDVEVDKDEPEPLDFD